MAKYSIGSRVRAKLSALMKRVFNNRELWIYTPIYFLLSFTNLIIKLRLTPRWTSGYLINNHNALLAFQYFNNEQSRLLQFLIPEFFHRLLDLTIVSSYALARFLFVFLAFLAFHFYLRKWFSVAESFAGVLILSGSLIIPFLSQDLQESAPLLMLLFVLGLWAIREKKDLLFAGFLLIGGGLTNETMLVMPVGYFLYRLQSFKTIDLIKTGFRTALIALPAFVTQGLIRYINRGQSQLGGAYHLTENLLGIWNDLRDPIKALYSGVYIYPFLIFSIFWLYAVLGFPKSPRFLRSVFWIVPLFLVAHMITGIIRESRQMVPLAFIVIPMALFFIKPIVKKERDSQYNSGQETGT